MKSWEGRRDFRRYVCFLVQLAHYDSAMVSRFTYPEIAVAAILVTCNLLQDASAAEMVPVSMLSAQSKAAAKLLTQLASNKGLQGLQEATTPKADGELRHSPTDVAGCISTAPSWA